MNQWLSTRNGWTLLLLNWATVLAAALLGYAVSRTWSGHTEPFARFLPWLLGGTLLVAVTGTAGALRRRSRRP